MNNLFFREMSSSCTPSYQLQNAGQGQQFWANLLNEKDDGGKGLSDIHFGMLAEETTGHNTGQGSRSGVPEEYEVTAGSNRIWEQGSGSGLGLAQANILGTDTPTAVAEQSSKKSNGKGALYSKRHRDKIKKLEQEIKGDMERLREENEELKRNCCESDAKLNVLRRRIRLSKVRSANYKKAYDNQQNQLNSLLKSLENMSYLQQENTELKAEKEFLIQQLNPNTKGKNLAKKWLKIPLENRVLKIKGRNLFLKIA